MQSSERLFSTKNRISYPRILNDEMKLLSFNKEDSVLIGSASYKIQKYPADVDLYEIVSACCSKKDAIEYFTNGIKAIVNELGNKRYHWVIEVKCGIDDRYDFPLTPDNIVKFISTRQNLLNNKDITEIYALLNSPSEASQERLEEIFRKYRIIRWGSNEVQSGLQIRNGRQFKFEDCVDMHSPINIEVIAVVDGEFTDLSNFYVVMFRDKITGDDVVINFPQNYITNGRQFVVDGLKEGIRKVLFSKLHPDVFKGIKRMFSLARLTDDVTLLNKISPIISSDLSALSQIKSELSTMIEIVEHTSELPWNIYFKQLDNIKWKIGGNTYLSDDQIYTYSEIINDVMSNKNDIKYIINNLIIIRNDILLTVNNYSRKYLQSKNLYK